MADVKMETVAPADAGLDADRLDRLKEVIAADISADRYHGAVTLVARGGKIAFHEALGFTDKANQRAAATDDVFLIFSVVKVMVGILALAQVDKGMISLDTPVAEIIPEFGCKGKHRVTLFNLLTQTAGLPVDPPMLSLESFGDLQTYVAAVCNMVLQGRPGSKVCYSPLNTHAVIGEIIRRVDGGTRPLRRILDEDLLQPLGMEDTSLGLRPRLAARRVPVAHADTTPGLFEPLMLEAMNDLLLEETEIPGGGALSTATDIFRLAEMLRCRGELNGRRILSQAMVRLATTNQTGRMKNEIFDYAREMHDWPDFPAYLGLSFFLRGEGLFPTPFGLQTSPGTFAGLGAGSMVFWVDPERDLTFVCLTAGLIEEGKSFLRFQKLSDLAVSAVMD